MTPGSRERGEAAEREPATEEEQSFEGRIYRADIPGIPPEGTLVLGTRKHGNHAVPAVLSSLHLPTGP